MLLINVNKAFTVNDDLNYLSFYDFRMRLWQFTDIDKRNCSHCQLYMFITSDYTIKSYQLINVLFQFLNFLNNGWLCSLFFLDLYSIYSLSSAPDIELILPGLLIIYKTNHMVMLIQLSYVIDKKLYLNLCKKEGLYYTS